MSTTLCDIVADFVDRPPGNIRAVIIHLARAKERAKNIQAIEAAIKSPLHVRDAIEGASLIASGHPTKCGIDEGVQRTPGEVGCAASHLDAYFWALELGLSHLIVFEDDCIPSAGFSLDAVREYLRRAKRFAREFQLTNIQHLTLLSTCGCYSWKHLTRLVKTTNHFNGSHAYVISNAMMRKVIEFYRILDEKRETAPIDGVLPALLKRERSWAFCPENDIALFRQNRDIPSYVASDGTARREG
jgi:GR25 family glycosyltransferase involved in LPS biosynthesis